MREIVHDVLLFEHLGIVNVYLLVWDAGLTVVDTGLARSVDEIGGQLREAGYALTDVCTIVLTHAHGDHVGGAAELARRSGAEVIAHRLEVPYAEQRAYIPARSAVTRILNRLSSTVMRAPPVTVGRAVDEGDTLDALGGLEVVHTPGHTPGSICLYQPERKLLFCGDALFNANPMTRRPGLILPPRVISCDNAQARASVEGMLDLEFDVLCAGHGEPILTGAREAIQELIGEDG